jgi:RND superfamily putative drug exporter
MLKSVTRFSIRYRTPVVAIWLAIIAAGILSSATLSSRLTTSLTVPGSESDQAEFVINSAFHEKSEGLITITLRFGTKTPSEVSTIKQSVARISSVVPNSRVVQQQAIAGTLFTLIATNNNLPETAKAVEPLRSALFKAGFSTAMVSGPPAIYSDVRPVLANDLHRGELIAVLSALVLLFIALGFSWSVLIPLIFATATVSMALVAVSIATHFTTMVLYIPNIVELIGFGLAVDYSLLLLHRYREENRKNPTASADSLIQATMNSAGRTVIISGSTVTLALSALLFFPIPFIRSLGIAGVLVPIASLLATITLAPALFSIAGSRGLSAYKYKGLLNKSHSNSRFISALVTQITSHPKKIFFATLVLLTAIALPAISLQVTPSSLTAIPKTLESSKALEYVTSRVGNGIITPIVVIADFGKAGAVVQNTEARVSLAQQLAKDPEVLTVAQGNNEPYIDSSSRYARIFLFGKHDIGSKQMQSLVSKVRNFYLPNSPLAKSAHFYVGGTPSQGVDLVDRISTSAPFIFGSALVIIFLLLMFTLRSVILPLKAIALDIISIAAACGVLVTFFKVGVGKALFHTYQLPQIEIWVLIFLVVILFGISMDYEVFIVSRIREAWLNGAPNDSAVVDGFSRTVRVVTSAALIFITAVSGFISSHFAGLQELGVGLAAAIFIDATLIRLLLLPTSMILLGNLNWWMPNRKSRHL